MNYVTGVTFDSLIRKKYISRTCKKLRRDGDKFFYSTCLRNGFTGLLGFTRRRGFRNRESPFIRFFLSLRNKLALWRFTGLIAALSRKYIKYFSVITQNLAINQKGFSLPFVLLINFSFLKVLKTFKLHYNMSKVTLKLPG